MDSNTSQIDQIVAKTGEQLAAFTQKIQHLVDTGDLSNPSVSLQAQLFTSQLSLISNAGSAMLKAFADASKSIITRIGT